MEVLFIAFLLITVFLNFFFIKKHVRKELHLSISGIIMVMLAFIGISILITWTEQESKDSWTAFFGIVYGYFLAGNGILLLIIGIIQSIVQSIRKKTKKL